jgi:hypothetical protein
MRPYARLIGYILVLNGFSSAFAGPNEDFVAALKQDDAWRVSQLLQRGFAPKDLGPRRQSGLFLALQEPAPKVARVLTLWPSTPIDERNAADETPLMMAALKGHLGIAQLLIERGADVNKTGWAPLHYAATGGQVALIQLLLEHHAYIDAESPNGTTPLMMAAQYGTLAAVKALLAAGADPALKNQLGLTAEDFAARASRPDVGTQIELALRARLPRGW